MKTRPKDGDQKRVGGEALGTVAVTRTERTGDR